MVRMKQLRGGFWVTLGYMLSPLSWWNDIFFNLPIAYAFAYAVTWGRSDWFFPATVIGYWLSNVLGFVLMQWGATDILQPDQPANWRRDLAISLGSSTVYTLIVAGLVYWHVLQIPDFLALTP